MNGSVSHVASSFPRLRPFDERHASLFFGREAEIATLVERLRHETVLPLVGPSGAGKSSLVQAGLIPRLREQGRLLVLSIRPGSQPFAALAGTLLHPGPSGNLLAVGHESGQVSLLGRRDGREVDRMQLHGRMVALEVTRSHLVLLSDLGDHRAIDLTPFRQSRCDLLREVWRQVPVVWRHGRAVRQAPPADHPCRKPGRP